MLVGNLKLELTEYSWQLYGGRDSEDDDDGGDNARGLESTLSYQPRKRCF